MKPARRKKTQTFIMNQAEQPHSSELKNGLIMLTVTAEQLSRHVLLMGLLKRGASGEIRP